MANFVSAIHEKALEAVAMPEVAKGMGYTHPSSTPFYRRMTAARLFGLLGSTRAELTIRARDYLKPDSDDARSKALQEAVSGISLYAEELQKHLGKKLNVQFVANSFARALNLSDGCALVCAKAFEASLRMAGLISVDGLVGRASPFIDQSKAQEEQAREIFVESSTSKGNSKTHSLPLDKKGTRSISVTAPLDISAKEIARIKKWLEVTLVIESDDDAGGGSELPS